MAIAKFCAGHWATMAHDGEEAAYPADGQTCDFCEKPAARAAGHEPEPTPRGHLTDADRLVAFPSDAPGPARLPSIRPSKAPPK